MPFTRFKVFAAIAGLLLVMGGGRFLYTDFAPACRLTHWHIHGTVPPQVHKTLKTTLRAFKGTPLHTLNLSALQTCLQKNPWILSVKLHRQWPHSLHIYVQSHVPLAVWQCAAKEYHLLSHMGQIIPLKDPHQWSKTLPLVVGGDVTPFLHTLKTLTSLPYPVTPQAFVVHPTGRWDIILPPYGRVQLPLKNPEKALYILPQIHRRLRTRIQKIHVIDLRFLPLVKVRFAP